MTVFRILPNREPIMIGALEVDMKTLAWWAFASVPTVPTLSPALLTRKVQRIVHDWIARLDEILPMVNDALICDRPADAARMLVADLDMPQPVADQIVRGKYPECQMMQTKPNRIVVRWAVSPTR